MRIEGIEFEVGDFVKIKHGEGQKHEFVNRHRTRRIAKMVYDTENQCLLYYMGTNHKGKADNLASIGFRDNELELVTSFHIRGRPHKKRKTYTLSAPKQHSKNLKRAWETLPIEIKNARIGRLIKSVQRKPNKSEQYLFSILQENFPNEWNFVGDGQIIIDGLNPDFININGKKLIIELYGNFWHSKQIIKRSPRNEENKRIKRYAKYGYSTLIIWDKDLEKNPIGIIRQIKHFMSS